MDIKDSKSLIFLYNTVPGRIILKAITKPVFSKPSEKLTNSKISKLYIKRFIKKNNIDMTQFKQTKYQSLMIFSQEKLITQNQKKILTIKS